MLLEFERSVERFAFELQDRQKVYSSAVQRSYVLGHNSLMPMGVRASPHYYYYYYYYHHHHLIRTTATTTNNNNNGKIFNSTQTFKNFFLS
jgi:hypothetical protein